MPDTDAVQATLEMPDVQTLESTLVAAYAAELIAHPPIGSCNATLVGAEQAELNATRFARKDVARFLKASDATGHRVVTVETITGLAARLHETQIALGKAAREIHCAGPVDHRIRILRAEHADRVGRMETVIDAARAYDDASSTYEMHYPQCDFCQKGNPCDLSDAAWDKVKTSQLTLAQSLCNYDKAREASKVADYRQAAEQIREHGDRMEAELRIVWRWMLGVWNSQEGHTAPMPEEHRLLLIRDIHRVAGLIGEEVPAYIPAQETEEVC